MKNKIKTWVKRAVMVAGVVLATVLPAVAGDFAAAPVNIPSFTATQPTLLSITNNVSTNQSAVASAVPVGVNGLTIVVNTTAAQATNGRPVILGFDITPDGTNWTTSQPWLITNNSFGTTNAGASLTLTADQLRGVKQFRYDFLSAISATAISVTSITYGWTSPQ